MSTYAIMPNRMLQIGDQFDNFQILAHLAQGGMSDIYRAFDLVNRRDVAIKIPDHSMIGDPAQYERFQRELEVINTLDHPAILKGLGFGKYNRVPYLITEFVDGQSLRTLVDEQAPLAVEQAVAIVRKVAEGLAYCHNKGVVHRDLKPENILITADGQPIIMDFGLALTKGSHRVTYSNLSATMGTPDYMAPEQIEGQRGDQRTDVYALGTILYELLSGKTPYSGDSNLAVMAQHLNRTPPRLDQINPAVPLELSAIAMCCLSRNPSDRYTNMENFIEALGHPETTDLSILDKINTSTVRLSFWRSQEVKAIGIALLALAALVLLAMLLQAIH